MNGKFRSCEFSAGMKQVNSDAIFLANRLKFKDPEYEV